MKECRTKKCCKNLAGSWVRGCPEFERIICDDWLFFYCSRKRREADNYKFLAVHVIVLNVVDTSNSVGTEVEIFVLDAISTSPLPDKALSSENLKDLILIMQQRNLLTYTLKSVDEVIPPPPLASGKTKESTSKAPVIAGVIIAVLVLIGLVFAIWMYNRRRKNKK